MPVRSIAAIALAAVLLPSAAVAADLAEDDKAALTKIADDRRAVLDKAEAELGKLAERLAAADADKNAAMAEGLTKRVQQIVSVLGDDAYAATPLKAALKRAEDADEPSAAIAMLGGGIQRALDRLTFEVTFESDMPPAFPDPAPLGEVVPKVYPAYRLARAEMKGRNGAFFTLFRHIQKNDIAMTAPVEMTMSGQTTAMKDMGFMYEHSEQGELGLDGEVEVVDIEPMLAISVGMNGVTNRQRIEWMQQKLDAWLKANPDWKQVGEPRVMGYNSPMMPNNRKFFEVEYIIERANANANADDAKAAVDEVEAEDADGDRKPERPDFMDY